MNNVTLCVIYLSLQCSMECSDPGSVQVWSVWAATEGPSHHHLWTQFLQAVHQQLLEPVWSIRRLQLSPVQKEIQSTTLSKPWHNHGTTSVIPTYNHDTTSCISPYSHGTIFPLPTQRNGTASSQAIYNYGTSSSISTLRLGAEYSIPTLPHGTDFSTASFGWAHSHGRKQTSPNWACSCQKGQTNRWVLKYFFQNCFQELSSCMNRNTI